MTEVLEGCQSGFWRAFAVPFQRIVNTQPGLWQPLIYRCYTLKQVVLFVLRSQSEGFSVCRVCSTALSTFPTYLVGNVQPVEAVLAKERQDLICEVLLPLVK